ARRARITLEMKMMSQALEQLKNDLGSYPPNVWAGASTTGVTLKPTEIDKNISDLKVFLTKASSQSTENYNVQTLANYGLSPAEALVFWLEGFSQDVRRPFSGSDLKLTSVDDGQGGSIDNVVTIDSFKPRFDFDRGRLKISRDADDK